VLREDWNTLFLASLDGEKRWLGVLTVQTSTPKHDTANGANHTSKKKQRQETFHAKGLGVHANTTECQILSL